MSMLAYDWLSRLISAADFGVWTHPHFTQIYAPGSDDRKCPESPEAPTDFGT